MCVCTEPSQAHFRMFGAGLSEPPTPHPLEEGLGHCTEGAETCHLPPAEELRLPAGKRQTPEQRRTSGRKKRRQTGKAEATEFLTMTAWSHTFSCGCPGTSISLCRWTTGARPSRTDWYSALVKLHGQKHRGWPSQRSLNWPRGPNEVCLGRGGGLMSSNKTWGEGRTGAGEEDLLPQFLLPLTLSPRPSASAIGPPSENSAELSWLLVVFSCHRAPAEWLPCMLRRSWRCPPHPTPPPSNPPLLLSGL